MFKKEEFSVFEVKRDEYEKSFFRSRLKVFFVCM